MKLLLIHADHMEYEVRRKTKVAEELPPGAPEKFSMSEVLVAFATVEAEDTNTPEFAAKVADGIFDVLAQTKAERAMLYPYAHLSPSLASPDVAIPLLKAIELCLKEKGVEVHRSPFGWYKGFDIKCKGHPLSELSKEIRPGEEEDSQAIKAEKKAVSEWAVMDLDGKMHPLRLDSNNVKGFDFGERKGLGTFCQYEMAKSRTGGKEPPHVELMQRMELVDYEPASDPGNFRFYPKGRLVKSLLEQYVTQKVKDTGGMEIESPIMYDYEHPSLKEYMNRFPARQYTIQTPDKKVFLRFAACFGQFLMMHDATISYRNLPMRLYELTRYSFRVEQRGELAGMRRLRAFTMPDCHSFCADVEMAKKEMESRFELSRDIISGFGIKVPDELELALRVTKEFYDGNKDFLASMVKRWGKPALVEMWSERFFYFIFKYEWNFVDSSGKASALNTDQMDVENAERYGIVYVGSDGKEHHPLILHQSPSGAIERVIYAMLENAHIRQQRGEKPELPLWLTPTQVRFIPVSDEFVEDCVKMAKDMDARADVDDREETVGKRIRDAEREWASMIIVYGQKERASGKLPVRMRDGKSVELTTEEVSRMIAEGTEGFPKATLALPMMLSKRAIFRG
ncbi:MAG: threonine--tRNA ligase [Euryarchaeota archaeon]|nr:threonine--tRNA ligase [Euryarchaeota archaeon]